MIPYYIITNPETVNAAGPGLVLTALCFAAYALYVNVRDRNK